MPARDDYAPGTPSWVDLGSPDVAGAARFYGQLFRWDARVGDEAAGGYTMCFLRGRPVAGLGPQTNPGPPAWTTYVSVQDTDATAAAAAGAGGRVLMGPLDVLDAGRMAVIADPHGAVVALWQPGAHRGAGLVNEPGTLSWNELVTPDVEAAKAFYGKVFGWDSETHDMGPMNYTEWKVGGESVGGMVQLTDEFPPALRPSWLVYFAVDDCDDTVAKAESLGGKALSPAVDIPAGRFAPVSDPYGAAFYVMRLAG